MKTRDKVIAISAILALAAFLYARQKGLLSRAGLETFVQETPLLREAKFGLSDIEFTLPLGEIFGFSAPENPTEETDPIFRAPDYVPEYSPPIVQDLGVPAQSGFLNAFFSSFVPDTGTIPVSKYTTLDSIYQKWGNHYGVDWRLLKAVARVESDENPSAKNPSDPSYGLMQVYCKNDGTLSGQCQNKLNVTGWEGASPGNLYDPDFNVMIAAQILAWNIRTYGFERGIAVYNRWESRNDPANGPFGNQSYVNKVLTFFASNQNSYPESEF